MCCQSKKKPVATTTNTTQVKQPIPAMQQPVNLVPNPNYPYTSNVAGSTMNVSRTPKSTISFSAQDYDSTPLNNQAAFVATKKVTHIVHDRGDRMEDYATEENTANKSKMILEYRILNYDLDIEDGVARTPVINTFHYESVLNHCFIRPNVQNSNLRNGPTTSAYYNQVNTSRLDNRGSAQLNSSNLDGRGSGVNTYTTNVKNPNNPYAEPQFIMENDTRISHPR